MARGGVKRTLFGRIRRMLLWVVVLILLLTLAPVLSLRWIAPPTSAFMLEKRFGPLLAGKPAGVVRYRWVDWQAISAPMRLAAVAAEDQKFPRHWGFDFDSIEDALQRKTAHGRLRGASTISQQVARNLFLWPGRSYVRKGLEAYFTVLLELLWPKRRILEVYLNVAEFGEGTYGVGAAARDFFGKSPSALTHQEAALLAAALPSPARLHVRNPSPYLRERAAWIEEQMAQLGPAYLKAL